MRHLDAWLARTPPDEAVVAAARLLAIGLSWWLGVGLVLYAVATLARLGQMARAVAWAIPRPLRRLVDGALVASVMASTVPFVAPAAPAAAHARTATAASQPAPSTEVGTEPVPGTEHVVVPGEYLSLIAKRELGNGSLWPEICEDNRGVTQPDGRALRDCDLIRPAWRLRLRPSSGSSMPPPTTPAAAAPAPPSQTGPATPPSSSTTVAAPVQPAIEQRRIPASTRPPSVSGTPRQSPQHQPQPVPSGRPPATPVAAYPSTTEGPEAIEPPVPPKPSKRRPNGGDAVLAVGGVAAVLEATRRIRKRSTRNDSQVVESGPSDDEPPFEFFADAEEDEQAEIYVRVMGPVEIEGTDGELARAKSVELVAYLAIHPRGEDADRLMEALWPDKKPVSTTFNTTVSVARGALGTNAAGEHHVSHVERGLYRVEPSVQTDWAVLRATVRRVASVEDPLQRLDLLCTALELVRGEPFDGCRRGYEWARRDGTASNVEREIVEAAAQAAGWAMSLQQGKVARWAARQGLLASPGSERLYRCLMAAAGESGDRAEVERVMDELCAVREIADVNELDDSTLDLYKRWTGRGEGLSA